MKKALLLPFLFAVAFHAFGQANFEDATAAGLSHFGKNYSVAAADFNNDGWDDFFATRYEEPCSLFKNNGDGTFSDAAAAAGLSFIGTPACAVWADVNNDGWLDLFIGSRDEDNRLFIANGDGTFTDKATEMGLLPGGRIKSANFADINRDGHIDLYLARFNQPNILYKNNGNGTFTNGTLLSGTAHTGISMGAVFFDYDNDGDPDLYLSHDANQPNLLLKNNGYGQFIDVAIQANANVMTNGMGVDFGDVNNDGWMDIYITNLGENTLLLSNGNPNNSVVTFSNVTAEAGVNDPGMGWGCSFLDYDNDGWQDIYLANDSYFSLFPNVLYHNLGTSGTGGTSLHFENVSAGTCLASMEPGYGLACADPDDDGKPDIYLANFMGELGNQFFQNKSENSNNWLKIKAIGTASNRAAIGARVTVEAGGMTMTDEISGGSGYASQNSLTLHFGLGQATQVNKLTIRWPNGLTEIYDSLGVNMTVTATEGEGISFPEPLSAGQEPLPPHDDFSHNFPNPFSNEMTLLVRLAAPAELNIRLYDALGNFVETMAEGNFGEGQHNFRFDGNHLSGGVYFAKLSGGHFEKTIKILKR